MPCAVVPGQFYINEFGTLSWHRQMAVPGATLDAMLREVAPVLTKSIAENAAAVLQKTKPGAERMTWEELRKELLQTIDEALTNNANWPAGPPVGTPAPVPAKPKKMDDPRILPPLDAETLRLMSSAVADKSLKLRRTGSVLTVVVPCSQRDTAEAIATFDLINRMLANRVRAGKNVADVFVNIRQAVQIRYRAGVGLECSADLNKLARFSKNTHMPRPYETKNAVYPATIAAMRARGIEIQENFSIKGLLGEYAK